MISSTAGNTIDIIVAAAGGTSNTVTNKYITYAVAPSISSLLHTCTGGSCYSCQSHGIDSDKLIQCPAEINGKIRLSGTFSLPAGNTCTVAIPSLCSTTTATITGTGPIYIECTASYTGTRGNTQTFSATVTCAGGSTTWSFSLTFASAPVISYVSRSAPGGTTDTICTGTSVTSLTSCPIGGTITILGSNFSPVLANDALTTTNICSTITSITDTSIVCVLKSASPATPVTLDIVHVGGSSTNTIVSVTYVGIPTVTGITNSDCAVNNGNLEFCRIQPSALLTVTGTNFNTGVGSVTVGNVCSGTATVVDGSNGGTLTCTPMNKATATSFTSVNVIVTTSMGSNSGGTKTYNWGK
jgi:hypothetical protein